MIPIAINQVPVSCINTAAISNHVPATLIVSILKKENGRNGSAVRNKNRTYDLGNMQVNTRWLPILAHYGYTRDDLQHNPCKNVMAGSWILAKSLASGKTFWKGVGNYNSRDPDHNKKYRTQIEVNYQKISQILER